MEKTNIPTLHIHGQPMQHYPAKIIGTREALEKLHRILSRIVGSTQANSGIKEEFTAVDQEDFILEIQMVTEEDVRELRLPYHSLPWDKESV